MKIYGLVRLTKDPEMGNNVVRLSIAENQYNSATKENEGHFYNAVAFGKTAELLSKCKKGDRINISQGELSNNNYEKEGRTIYAMQIKIFGFDYIESKSSTQTEFVKQEGQRRQEEDIDVEPPLPF